MPVKNIFFTCRKLVFFFILMSLLWVDSKTMDGALYLVAKIMEGVLYLAPQKVEGVLYLVRAIYSSK